MAWQGLVSFIYVSEILGGFRVIGAGAGRGALRQGAVRCGRASVAVRVGLVALPPVVVRLLSWVGKAFCPWCIFAKLYRFGADSRIWDCPGLSWGLGGGARCFGAAGF